MRKQALLIAFFLGISVLADSAWAQCAMCRTALESSVEGQAIAGSFRHGILLLLAAPYAIIGAIGYVVFRAYRRKQSQ